MSLDRLTEERRGERPGFRADGRPLVCLEVNPPRGADPGPVFERLDGKLDGIDFLNVTDGALARMRCAALPFAALLKSRYGIETLVNLSCRDRNVIALQAELLAGWALGVRSVVALTGDAMTIGDHPSGKGVFEINSVGLLTLIAGLNGGRDVAGNELRGAPAFRAGAVCNPNVKNPAAEVRRLQKKREAGATYVLTQPVFDADAARAFLEAAAPVGLPIMLGLLPFKNAAAAERLSRVPGIKFPEKLLADLPAADDLSEFSVDYCVSLSRSVAGLVRGFHVVSGAAPNLGVALGRALAACYGSAETSSRRPS